MGVVGCDGIGLIVIGIMIIKWVLFEKDVF